MQLHENGPLEVLRYGNMDVYEIGHIAVICFACHDDLLFIRIEKKADYRLDCAGIKRFF